MGLRERMLAGFAAQLGKPTGLPGMVVGTMLNRTNRGMISDAVDALELQPGAAAADLGFGGGAGLALLWARGERAESRRFERWRSQAPSRQRPGSCTQPRLPSRSNNVWSAVISTVPDASAVAA